MIRATTGGVLKSYRSNLMKAFIAQNTARDTALTQRTFNSYAEDPAAAAKAFRLRKSMLTVNSQYNTCSETYRKYQTAWGCLDTVSKQIDTETSEPMSTLSGTTLSMLNDPNGDARTQLTKVLDQISQAIVQTMNQKYGDNFIFAGADGHNVPFEIVDNKLYYRGVSVDAAVPNVLTDQNGSPIMVNDNGEIDPAGENYISADAELQRVPQREENPAGTYVMLNANGEVDSGGTTYLLASATYTKAEYAAMAAPVTGALPDLLKKADGTPYETADGCYILSRDVNFMPAADYAALESSAMQDASGNALTVEKDGVTYFVTDRPESIISKEDYAAAQADADKLKYLAGESQFVDIGLGFQENTNGQLIESSAFDAALNGLTFLGYGVDADGDPKNIYSLVQRMKEIADSVPEGGLWTNEQYDEFHGLVKKLETASANFKTEYTNMSAGTTKLENNLELLEDNFYNVWEQTSDLEDVEMVEAITSFLWAQYAYNAALKVGNSILSESLMDYLS